MLEIPQYIAVNYIDTLDSVFFPFMKEFITLNKNIMLKAEGTI